MTSPSKKSDLKQVVSLHQKVLPHTLNSQIGPRFLTHLYQNIFNNDFSQLLLKKQNNTIIGFLSTTEDLHLLDKIIQSQSGIRIQILAHLVTHPHHSLNLLKKVLFSRFLKRNFPGKRAWILTLGVHPKFKRHGVGKTLIQQIVTDYRNKGIEVIYVDTEIGNHHAINFYHALSFTSIDRYLGNLILKKII